MVKPTAGRIATVSVITAGTAPGRIYDGAQITAITKPQVVIPFTPFVTLDPMGPVIGLENGPLKSAAYCIFVNNGTNNLIRLCGPSINGVRSPDLFFTFDWSLSQMQYVLIWNDMRRMVELWTDDTAGAGGIGAATLIGEAAYSTFNSFGSGGSRPLGGANDMTGIYGVEGDNTTSATFFSVATTLDVGSPFLNGTRPGGYKTYLDSDVTMGFSGAVDPTRLTRGGAWFVTPSGDPSGALSLSAIGKFNRLRKKTPATFYSIYRDEPGFQKTATDGFAVEFEVSLSVAGDAGFSTGTAFKISDGTSLYELDFFFDGSVYNLGLLVRGGNPGVPSDHLTPATAFDFRLKTMRLVVDSRRAVIDLFDTSNRRRRRSSKLGSPHRRAHPSGPSTSTV